MGRPVYPYELSDPDYYWLVSHFEETYPDYFIFEDGAQPVVFIREGTGSSVVELDPQSERDSS